MFYIKARLVVPSGLLKLLSWKELETLVCGKPILEFLRDKLKYAITHCQAIDTDGRPYEIWQDEE